MCVSTCSKVAAIIPTFNRKESLEVIVGQLLRQSCDKINFILDVIVVDDGSSDGTGSFIKKQFPNVRVVNGLGNWWYTKSINEGFYEAEVLSPDFILTLNDDIEIKANYVEALLLGYDILPSGSILGSISFTLSQPYKIIFSGVKSIKWWKYKEYNYLKTFEKRDPDELSGIYPSLVLPGRGMLIPFKTFKELNAFDEKFIQYGSDDDFCLRASKRHKKIFVCWDAGIFCKVLMTGKGTPYIRQPFLTFLSSFFSPYSKSYILKFLRIIYRYGNTFLIPVTILIVLAGTLHAYIFKYRKTRF
ncbi:MAG: glycosyltransferase family 2 protein [Methanococcaceae archaeon]